MAFRARCLLAFFAAAHTILAGLSHAQLPDRGAPYETASERSTFKATATVNEEPPAITLHWMRYGDGESPTVILCREKGAYAGGPRESWGQPYAVLDNRIDSFVDSNVEIGVQYEYRMRRNDPVQFDVVVAGIRITLAEKRGTILLVVDDNHARRLEEELSEFQFDLAGDGWDAARMFIDSRLPAAEVKARIQEVYRRDPKKL